LHGFRWAVVSFIRGLDLMALISYYKTFLNGNIASIL
jgi:hypothetical protein